VPPALDDEPWGHSAAPGWVAPAVLDQLGMTLRAPHALPAKMSLSARTSW
jgi:hypothetical protein